MTFVTVLFADDLNENKRKDIPEVKNPSTILENKAKNEINLSEIELTKAIVVDNILNFYSMLPEITGVINSLPKAGTIGIKFDKRKIEIHEGLKLVAKRKGIDQPYIGDGVIYLKYNKYHKLVGKYTRSQVGKFEISDKVNSKWYTPVIVIASITDLVEGNQELTNAFKESLLNSIEKNDKIRFKTNKRINTVLNKISTLSSHQKELKKLFGLGVDYVLFGDFIKEGDNRVLNVSIVSTYIGKSIFDIKIDTKL